MKRLTDLKPKNHFRKAHGTPPLVAHPDVLKKVIAAWPDLAGRRVRETGGEMNLCTVFIFDNQQVVKAVLYPALDSYIANESRWTRLMEGADFAPQQVQAKKGMFRMTETPGQALDLSRLTPKQARRTASGLARAMLGIDRVFKTRAGERMRKHAPRVRTFPSGKTLRAILKDDAVKAALGDGYAAVAEAVEDFLSRRNARKNIAFHADIKIDHENKASNVQVDPRTGAFLGLLDYGLILKGKPEEAFTNLYNNNRPFARLVAEEYARQGGEIGWKDVVQSHVAYRLEELSHAVREENAAAISTEKNKIAADLAGLKPSPASAAVSAPRRNR